VHLRTATRVLLRLGTRRIVRRVSRGESKLYHENSVEERLREVIEGRTGARLAGAATRFHGFPEAHWPRLRTTNGLERLHARSNGGSGPAGTFPDRASALRLITSVAIEVTTICGDRRDLDLSVLETQKVVRAAWRKHRGASLRVLHTDPDLSNSRPVGAAMK
jgi:hypothetical protein